ncbi:MAG: prepilin-type N-terminal cleavage/methylation domain-containing protein [Sedimentisphaerales bacterium]|nr:prepilin-type N-terminal cleavage/methylation domain-containing protein [Sedimentisphaerales bacterium]
MKTRTKAFTLVELLTVIGIISLLLALALPALNEARVRAREVGNKASLHSIGVAIESFANDMGYYPESNRIAPDGTPYRIDLENPGLPFYDEPDQGAHTLFEALFGLDKQGFQKGNYYQNDNDGYPIDSDGNETKRWGPYLELESIDFGEMRHAHPNGENFDPDGINMNPVFVDTLDKKAPKAILYYRARASKRLLWTADYDIDSIYNYNDNIDITQDTYAGSSDDMYSRIAIDEDFYRFIWDNRTGVGATEENRFYSSSARPYKKDSFILINAGRDHEYGTADDLCNFQKR